jgi:hypothetical protein
MKLRSVTLCNVRRFAGTVEVGPIADGLNVLSDANEQGKSTLFDAIQALFFAPHGSASKEVKSLRPYSGGAPEVSAVVETADGVFTLSKRWLGKAQAQVHRADRLIAQGGAAEDWISALVTGGEAGPSGLIWVRQGLLGLSEGTTKEREATLNARRDLLSSVTGEVEQLTGGRRMDAALTLCRKELLDYATATGRPRKDGPWNAAEERLAEVTARRDALQKAVEDLHDALALRKRRRAELAEIEDPQAIALRKDRLEAAERAFETAKTHADALASQAQKVDIARLSVTSLTARQTERREVEAEVAEAAAALAQIAARSTVARDAVTKAELTRQHSARISASARTASKEAAALCRKVRDHAAARQGQARRAELAERLRLAEIARSAAEEARAQTVGGLDEKALRQLERLASEMQQARAVRDAAAPQVSVSYEAGQTGRVTLNGAPVEAPLALPEGGVLALPGIGELHLRVAGGEAQKAQVARAEQAFHDALAARSLPSLDAARQAAEQHAAALRRAEEAATRLEALAPKGLEPLHADLAAIPALTSDETLPDVDAAENALVAASDAALSAQEADVRAAATLAQAESRLSGDLAAQAAAADRKRRADARLAALAPETPEGLADQLRRAVLTLEAEEALLRDKSAAAPDLIGAKTTRDRLRSVAEKTEAERVTLREDLAKLETQISLAAESGVEEALAEATEAQTAAARTLAHIQFEVQVLRRLLDALEQARAEARDRYFAPVAKELRPLLHLLWPDAELEWEDQTLLPSHLVRDGQSEALDILSGGTQEQIALLVRLAFARMLAHAGRPAPVILDDALIFSDDTRIERMFDALHRQAGDLQILVLSCRQRAFRDLGGHKLVLRPR